MRKIPYVIVFLILSGFSAYGQCGRAHKSLYSGVTVSPGFCHLEDNYDIKHYFIDLELSDTSVFLSGSTTVYFEILEYTDTLVFELDNEIEVDSISCSEMINSSFIHESNLLKIPLPDPLEAGQVSMVKVSYKGSGESEGFFSGLSNRTDSFYEVPVTYTLSEPFQADSWFPVKQDLQDKADSVRIHITVDTSLMAGSNGLLQNIVNLDKGKHRFEWFSAYPIAYYLISFSVADYVDYSFYTQTGINEDSILVQNFIYDTPEINEYEFEKIRKTDDLLKLFSRLFGLYPFSEEKYGHCMAPMGGGMEHQTMTTLQNFNFELVAHELMHQWFGDYVTCGSWQDIWINEGFASYGEYLALEKLVSIEDAKAWMESAQATALRIEDGSIYLSEEEAGDVSRIFSLSLSYKKGAAIIHMLRYELGNDDLFFSILKTFLEHYKNGTALAENFVEIVEEVSGSDYSWFFDQWYYGKGFPEIQVNWKQSGDSLLLNLSQSGSDASNPFFKTHIDFEIAFQDGSDTIITFLIEEPEMFFQIEMEKEIQNIAIDPYSWLLMKSAIFEYLPEEDFVEIGPNPFSDSVYLTFVNSLSEINIRISDVGGNIVFENEYPALPSLELSLNFLDPGVYLIVIEDEENRISRKLLKV